MFYPDYNYITDKLPISEKNKRIEDYLLHTLEIYQKSLDWNRKTMDQKKLCLQSWPECPAPLTLPISYVTDNGTQTDNKDHESLLDQLPPSMKKDVWLRLTNCKNRPLTEEQKIKFEANTSSDGSSTLSRLDGFEKQLEEREALLKQKENNIKNTIEVQHQLEDQHNSRSGDLERQYKSRIATLDKSIIVKDKEIGKLSSTISQLKNDKKDIKKSAERRDSTIEPNSYFSHHDTKLWTGKREDAKNDINIRKKYTFRMRV
ncbi:hypothetical protein C1645_819761 [Glomus cerebriforme]|uniref:Uncharacterized protein n=1 Tax=Glomus cerebriforme TaxID=658196 RepID=A0A397T4P3_9GLOM|nr:hypothetical protein C1645_819761 [Glomus cerebriforme]